MEKTVQNVKDLMYSSIGIVAINAKRLQEQLNKVSEAQKEQQEEGEKIVNDFFKNSNEKGKNIGKKLGEILKTFTKAQSEKVEELKARIEEIESNKN